MSDVVVDVLLPRTDGGALAQAIIAVPVFALVLWRVRHNREVRTFVAGVATLTVAWFALRTVH